MAELREDDEVTLVATITVRYTAHRRRYRTSPTAPLPHDDVMAAIDESQVDVLGAIEELFPAVESATLSVRPESAR